MKRYDNYMAQIQIVATERVFACTVALLLAGLRLSRLATVAVRGQQPQQATKAKRPQWAERGSPYLQRDKEKERYREAERAQPQTASSSTISTQYGGRVSTVTLDFNAVCERDENL